eukprot:gene26932-4554_t
MALPEGTQIFAALKCQEDAVAAKVVWARVRGYPFWPAQVLSKKAAQKRLGQFFGTLEIAWLAPADVMDFKAGVEKGLHLKAKQKSFLRALDQLADFLSLDKKRKMPQFWWCKPPATGDGKEAEVDPTSGHTEAADKRRKSDPATLHGGESAKDVSSDGEDVKELRVKGQKSSSAKLHRGESAKDVSSDGEDVKELRVKGQKSSSAKLHRGESAKDRSPSDGEGVKERHVKGRKSAPPKLPGVQTKEKGKGLKQAASAAELENEGSSSDEEEVRERHMKGRKSAPAKLHGDELAKDGSPSDGEKVKERHAKGRKSAPAKLPGVQTKEKGRGLKQATSASELENDGSSSDGEEVKERHAKGRKTAPAKLRGVQTKEKGGGLKQAASAAELEKDGSSSDGEEVKERHAKGRKTAPAKLHGVQTKEKGGGLKQAASADELEKDGSLSDKEDITERRGKGRKPAPAKLHGAQTKVKGVGLKQAASADESDKDMPPSYEEEVKKLRKSAPAKLHGGESACEGGEACAAPRRPGRVHMPQAPETRLLGTKLGEAEASKQSSASPALKRLTQTEQVKASSSGPKRSKRNQEEPVKGGVKLSGVSPRSPVEMLTSEPSKAEPAKGRAKLPGLSPKSPVEVVHVKSKAERGASMDRRMGRQPEEVMKDEIRAEEGALIDRRLGRQPVAGKRGNGRKRHSTASADAERSMGSKDNLGQAQADCPLGHQSVAGERSSRRKKHYTASADALKSRADSSAEWKEDGEGGMEEEVDGVYIKVDHVDIVEEEKQEEKEGSAVARSENNRPSRHTLCQLLPTKMIQKKKHTRAEALRAQALSSMRNKLRGGRPLVGERSHPTATPSPDLLSSTAGSRELRQLQLNRAVLSPGLLVGVSNPGSSLLESQLSSPAGSRQLRHPQVFHAPDASHVRGASHTPGASPAGSRELRQLQMNPAMLSPRLLAVISDAGGSMLERGSRRGQGCLKTAYGVSSSIPSGSIKPQSGSKLEQGELETAAGPSGISPVGGLRPESGLRRGQGEMATAAGVSGTSPAGNVRRDRTVRTRARSMGGGTVRTTACSIDFVGGTVRTRAHSMGGDTKAVNRDKPVQHDGVTHSVVFSSPMQADGEQVTKPGVSASVAADHVSTHLQVDGRRVLRRLRSVAASTSVAASADHGTKPRASASGAEPSDNVSKPEASTSCAEQPSCGRGDSVQCDKDPMETSAALGVQVPKDGDMVDGNNTSVNQSATTCELFLPIEQQDAYDPPTSSALPVGQDPKEGVMVDGSHTAVSQSAATCELFRPEEQKGKQHSTESVSAACPTRLDPDPTDVRELLGTNRAHWKQQGTEAVHSACPSCLDSGSRAQQLDTGSRAQKLPSAGPSCPDSDPAILNGQEQASVEIKGPLSSSVPPHPQPPDHTTSSIQQTHPPPGCAAAIGQEPITTEVSRGRSTWSCPTEAPAGSNICSLLSPAGAISQVPITTELCTGRSTRSCPTGSPAGANMQGILSPAVARGIAFVSTAVYPKAPAVLVVDAIPPACAAGLSLAAEGMAFVSTSAYPKAPAALVLDAREWMPPLPCEAGIYREPSPSHAGCSECMEWMPQEGLRQHACSSELHKSDGEGSDHEHEQIPEASDFAPSSSHRQGASCPPIHGHPDNGHQRDSGHRHDSGHQQDSRHQQGNRHQRPARERVKPAWQLEDTSEAEVKVNISRVGKKNSIHHTSDWQLEDAADTEVKVNISRVGKKSSIRNASDRHRRGMKSGASEPYTTASSEWARLDLGADVLSVKWPETHERTHKTTASSEWARLDLGADVARLKWPEDSLSFSLDDALSFPPEFFCLPKEWLANKPPEYDPIRRNIWVSLPRPKRLNKVEFSICMCTPSSAAAIVLEGEEDVVVRGCTDAGCLNRLSYIHCDPKTCPSGELCSNRPFHQLEGPPMEAFPTEGRGYGVRALQPVARGSFLIEYAGEVIDSVELERRMLDARVTGEPHYYIMELEPGLFIDARKKANLARLLNSSCDPNCETQKWRDATTGETRVGIFSRYDIAPGEELTYNYFFEHYGVNTPALGSFTCLCGAKNCRGTMDPNPEKRKDLGRRVEVRWDGDGALYSGTVVGYIAASRRHIVLYDLGDKERVHLDEVEHYWLDAPPLDAPPLDVPLAGHCPSPLHEVLETAVPCPPPASQQHWLGGPLQGAPLASHSPHGQGEVPQTGRSPSLQQEAQETALPPPPSGPKQLCLDGPPVHKAQETALPLLPTCHKDVVSSSTRPKASPVIVMRPLNDSSCNGSTSSSTRGGPLPIAGAAADNVGSRKESHTLLPPRAMDRSSAVCKLPGSMDHVSDVRQQPGGINAVRHQLSSENRVSDVRQQPGSINSTSAVRQQPGSIDAVCQQPGSVDRASDVRQHPGSINGVCQQPGSVDQVSDVRQQPGSINSTSAFRQQPGSIDAARQQPGRVDRVRDVRQQPCNVNSSSAVRQQLGCMDGPSGVHQLSGSVDRISRVRQQPGSMDVLSAVSTYDFNPNRAHLIVPQRSHRHSSFHPACIPASGTAAHPSCRISQVSDSQTHLSLSEPHGDNSRWLGSPSLSEPRGGKTQQQHYHSYHALAEDSHITNMRHNHSTLSKSSNSRLGHSSAGGLAPRNRSTLSKNSSHSASPPQGPIPIYEGTRSVQDPLGGGCAPPGADPNTTALKSLQLSALAGGSGLPVPLFHSSRQHFAQPQPNQAMGQGKERGPMSTVINSQILASMPAAQMSTLALFRAAKLGA